MNKKVKAVLKPHEHLFSRILKGETRFRSIKHFVYECRDVDDRDEFTEEEWQAKQAVLEGFRLNQVGFDECSNS